MKRLTGLLFFITTFSSFCSFAQKNLAEGTLVYNISVETGSSQPKMPDMLDGATTTIYLKGDQSRTEMVSSLGSKATLYNAATGSGVILNDYSGQKIMITLSSKDWENNNKKYEGIIFENTGEKAQIAGYNCQKAIAKLKDGSTFTVYYTREVNIVNKNYDFQFKTLPGLPVQYEMQTGKMKIQFTLAKVGYGSVSVSKLEIPKSGYRVMTYEEAKNR